MDAVERAIAYLAKCPPSIAGSGGHDACFKAAKALVVGFDLGDEKSLDLMRSHFNPGCQPPWSEKELRHKVTSAWKHPGDKEVGWLLGDNEEERQASVNNPTDGKRVLRGQNNPTDGKRDLRGQIEKPEPEFQPEVLQRQAARLGFEVTTEWLANRSPVDPYSYRSPGLFLSSIAHDGEYFVVCTGALGKGSFLFDRDRWGFSPLKTDWSTQPPTLSRGDGLLGELPADALGTEGGAWFMCQPVRGEPVDGSWWAQGAVTAWRYMVLEIDVEGFQREWLAFLVAAALPIEAIYTSGSKSVHALLRVDDPSKEEWDATRDRYKTHLVSHGADPKALTAVRQTRLPGAYRAGRLQKLLYLAPRADVRAIADLPEKRSVRKKWGGSDEARRYFKL